MWQFLVGDMVVKHQDFWVKSSSYVRDVGDEPLQIKRKFPNVSVAVSENRQKGIQKLLEHNCQVVLLDDGYQHRWVKPGLSIC